MGAEDIQITTSYPVLRGQTDATFEFSLDVANKSEADRTFNLAAQAPEKWEVNFKPGYEQKQISSLRIRGKRQPDRGGVGDASQGHHGGRVPDPGADHARASRRPRRS